MAADSKDPTLDVKAAEAETQEELNRIIDDIDSIQKDMNFEEEKSEEKKEAPQAEKEEIEEFIHEMVPESKTDHKPKAPQAEASESKEVVDDIANLTEETMTTEEVSEESQESEEFNFDEEDMADFRGGSDEPSMEETLGAAPEIEETEGGLLDESVASAEIPAEKPAPQPQAEVIPMKPRSDSSSDEGCLEMKLTGQMNLKLTYEQNGNEVMIAFSEGFLQVRLIDGTEFKIPVSNSVRKAA